MSDITYRADEPGWVSVPVSPSTPLPVTGTGGGDGSLFDVNIEEVGGVAVDNSEPAAVVLAPFTTLDTENQTITSSAVLMVPANATRRRLLVSADTLCFVGNSGVTTATGYPIPAASHVDFGGFTGALYVIGTSGTAGYAQISD